MTDEWMQDPAISHIPKEKLTFLQALVFESQTLSKEKLLPFLLSVAKSTHLLLQQLGLFPP